LKELAQSIVSVATFTSNIFFWLNTDYFSITAEMKPLLHTWSLGVEEQFYILFPLFMIVTKRVSRKTLSAWIAAFIGVSFLLCVYGSYEFPKANFYLPITRFWELLAGSLISIYLLNKETNKDKEINVNFKNFLSCIGVALLAYSLFGISSENFPGAITVFPVIGSGLIILSGNNNHSFVTSILSMKCFRYIGHISYSLYLWHWPIIAILKKPC
jgi:peptidoglycan/LPS O-acetylase OafA/YrhL